MLVFFIESRLSWRTALLRAVSLSRVTHCVPASAGYVLERNWRGCRVWTVETFVRHLRGRLLAIEVGLEPVAFPPEMETVGPYPWLDVGLTLLSAGSLAPRPMDCVGLTVALLRQAGLVIPRRIVTAAMLMHWLARDHEVHDLR